MKLTKTQLNKFKKHVLKEYPHEACAIVVDIDGKLKVINCKNTHEKPENHFKIDGSFIADYVINGQLRAVLHSHIAKSNHQLDIRTPSANDIQGQIDSNVPWGIVSTDGVTVSDPLWIDDNEIQPLLERQFISGIHDCYSIWRDYYILNFGIKMRRYAIDYNWWNNNFNFYSDENIASEGFIEIPFNEVREHDVIIFKIASPVPNHVGVCCGNNKMVHQLNHRLSCEDSISKWRKYIHKCYRYKDFF